MGQSAPLSELDWARPEVYFLKRENEILRQRIGNLEQLAGPRAAALPPSGCILCEKGMQTSPPRQCADCDHVFAGKGWEGLDSHWKANHLDVMSYEELWNSLCRDHRGE